MDTSTEYQIIIGCNDSQLRQEVVNENELTEMVSQFFRKNHIDFSLMSLKGGYLHEDGWFITENSLCISIVGDTSIDIIKLAKSLSMFMNQENILVIKHTLKAEFC